MGLMVVVVVVMMMMIRVMGTPNDKRAGLISTTNMCFLRNDPMKVDEELLGDLNKEYCSV